MTYFWDHEFSTYARLSKKLKFLRPLIGVRTYPYQEVKNVSFSENFAYVLKRIFLDYDLTDKIRFYMIHDNAVQPEKLRQP